MGYSRPRPLDARWVSIAVKFQRLTPVFAEPPPAGGWFSHAMAPAPLLLGDRIRVFVGGWDETGISRIFFVDVAREDPSRLIGYSKDPVLDLGDAGCFDDNGVFPGSVTTVDEMPILYFTGFQIGQHVRHFNFSGAARISGDGPLQRVSKAPVLDRADEGLHVRAGLSTVRVGSTLMSAYSAGSTWLTIDGVSRPVYDVYMQHPSSPVHFDSSGLVVLRHEPPGEHALGRPQLILRGGEVIVLFTTRTTDMRYRFGAARASRSGMWSRVAIDGLEDTIAGFDDEMTYFPGPVMVDDRLLVFYSGNGFGRTGLGVGEIRDCSMR